MRSRVYSIQMVFYKYLTLAGSNKLVQLLIINSEVAEISIAVLSIFKFSLIRFNHFFCIVSIIVIGAAASTYGDVLGMNYLITHLSTF